MGGRGRPRIYAEGPTATQRVAASTAALVASGGARKTFRLSAPAHAALKRLLSLPDAPKTETEIVENLLLAEAARQP